MAVWGAGGADKPARCFVATVLMYLNLIRERKVRLRIEQRGLISHKQPLPNRASPLPLGAQRDTARFLLCPMFCPPWSSVYRGSTIMALRPLNREAVSRAATKPAQVGPPTASGCAPRAFCYNACGGRLSAMNRAQRVLLPPPPPAAACCRLPGFGSCSMGARWQVHMLRSQVLRRLQQK